MANDQRQHWNKLHQQNKTELEEPSLFAKEVQKVIPPKSSLLELGCGSGRDSFFFAEHGNSVLATDFSKVAVEKNKKKYQSENLTFEVLNMSNKTSFENSSFDVIYSRLSLHYFPDIITKRIFKELYRLLKPSGYVCFICKSTEDPLFGKGKKIEKDMFEYNGHIRHFFSEEYARECLGEKFGIREIESGKENFYNRPSAFLKVIAQKK
jgi:ubiquinone/menaquinone biosynthesis C-methylase UbiE